MNIREIHENKKQFLPLLLLADEQEDMIDRYLERGTMYVLEDGGVKAECVVTDEGGGILELKNLAVEPEAQGKGYGKALIDFLVRQYAGCYALLQVGTGDSPLTVPFYEKCGFVRSHRIPNFFTDHYDHPIYEAGVQLVDMVYLQRKLCHPACKPRCWWCSLANPLYVRYHDEEWGVPCHDDHALYELLILESFQAGLSWETVLNKRQRFREVYDGFDLDKVCAYGEEKSPSCSPMKASFATGGKFEPAFKTAASSGTFRKNTAALTRISGAGRRARSSTKMTPPLPPARCQTPFPRT